MAASVLEQLADLPKAEADALMRAMAPGEGNASLNLSWSSAACNAGGLLPAADRDVDIERVELDHPSDPARTLGCQNCRAAAAERIEDDAVAPATVTNQVGDECHRLDGGVQIEVATPSRMQTVDARIIEHVGAIPAVGAEPEIVDVGSVAALEDGDQLML